MEQLNLNFDDYLPPFRGSSLYSPNSVELWTGSDRKTLFESNLRKFPNDSDLLWYKDNPIKYEMNNYGYRTPYNFKRGDEVTIYLGCSHTMGVGQPFEDTWVYRLHQQLNDGTELVNLSQGGVGIEDQFRQLYTWRGFFKIRNIFHFQPIYARGEFFVDQSFPKGKYKPQTYQIPYLLPKAMEEGIDSKFLISVLAADPQLIRTYITNVLAIEGLSRLMGINYYYEHNFPILGESLKGRKARDLSHPSTGLLGSVKEMFYERFKRGHITNSLLDQIIPNRLI
jgi:hypothetical protein